VIASAEVAWSSTDNSVVRVNSSGWVFAEANGSARVVASVGAVADTASIEVAQTAASITVSPGAVRLGRRETVQLTAAVLDANGNEIGEALEDLEWSTDDPSIVSVDPTGGWPRPTVPAERPRSPRRWVR
jgi:uncharacterized protein YjdB